VILGFVLLAISGAALISPGWYWARAQNPQSLSLLLLPAAGIGLWVALTAMGVGARSLSNLSEVLGVVVAAVGAAYLKCEALCL